MKKEGKKRISILIYTKFETLAPIGAAKSVTELFPLERKKNEQIKGLIRNMWLFLFHNTTHHYNALYQISES